MLILFLFRLDDVNSSTLEPDLTFRCCEQSAVSAHADVVAGEELCSALANDDLAGFSMLTAVKFYGVMVCVKAGIVRKAGHKNPGILVNL